MVTDADTNEDPYLWLEDITGKEALEWATSQSNATVDELSRDEAFESLRKRVLAILDSDERIPYAGKIRGYYYNFWRDRKNPRGLWRRTSLAEYRRDKPKWETVLDIDALAAEEDENWVMAGTSLLHPDYDRCLLSLSRGGADATVTREFDAVAKKFVADGFQLPESKHTIAWAGRDSVFVATDFGPGSMTESGYARIVKLWQRGQPLTDALTVFEGNTRDVSVSASASLREGYGREFVYRGRDFYNSDIFLRRDGKLIEIDRPTDAQLSMHRDRVYVFPESDWEIEGKVYKSGSALAMDADGFMAGKRDFDVLFEPSHGRSLAGLTPTLNHVILNELDNVRNRVYLLTPTGDDWRKEPLTAADGYQTISSYALEPYDSDDYVLHTSDFTTPPTMAIKTIGSDKTILTKSAPAHYDAEGLETSQHWVVSKDGTRVPYFQVSNPDVSEPKPTVLYGYGGFLSSLVPAYSPEVGAAWLEPGGVYVAANIRGGGEFGPTWHRAALKEHRHRAYEDFIAVAEDLIRRDVTTPRQLGITGGSNGGLLVGNALTMRPDLFGAVVCQAPLLDMYRYHKLLAGASWMAEYGDPEKPEEWRFIQSFSPYHNVRRDSEYPRILFTSSTRDDRVHPGHARKMVAKMKAMGHDVLYYENTEGGHAGAADNPQIALMLALKYRFLWETLA